MSLAPHNLYAHKQNTIDALLPYVPVVTNATGENGDKIYR